MTLSRALLITLAVAALGGCTVHRHYHAPRDQGQIRHPGYSAGDPGYAGAPGGYYSEQAEGRGPNPARESERAADGYGPSADDGARRCDCKCREYADRHVHKRYEPDNPSDWLE